MSFFRILNFFLSSNYFRQNSPIVDPGIREAFLLFFCLFWGIFFEVELILNCTVYPYELLEKDLIACTNLICLQKKLSEISAFHSSKLVC